MIISVQRLGSVCGRVHLRLAMDANFKPAELEPEAKFGLRKRKQPMAVNGALNFNSLGIFICRHLLAMELIYARLNEASPSSLG
jgi:hypothetical protein